MTNRCEPKTFWWFLLPLVTAFSTECASSPISNPAPPLDWPTANFDYANTRAVTSSAISAANVSQLGVDWTFGVNATSAFGALATTPVVQNRIVYLQDLHDNVYAIDLETGAPKWQKLYNAANNGPNGPAVDAGKVFVETTA